jgi:VIT1/CCC1 family predicted Fe2+/Mn2+ transporter
MKLTAPREKLLENMDWVNDATDPQVKGIGALELLGAIGLILPAVLDIAPILVPIAAVGLALTMLGAIVVHVRRKDPTPAIIAPAVLGLLAVAVAVGRFGPEAF